MKTPIAIISKIVHTLEIIICLTLFSCSEELHYLESGNLVVSKEIPEVLATAVNPFTVNNVEVISIAATEVVVRFTTSANSMAYIDYGMDNNYGEQNNGDFTFENATHQQNITALEPDTSYFYKIVAISEGGGDATASGTFTTAGSDDGSSTPAFMVDGLQVLELEDSEARIQFTASANAQAYIEYGTDSDYGSRTNREESFDYATHRQYIRNLKPETLYFYRVRTNDENWQTAFATGSFMTSSSSGGGDYPVAPVTGWNNDLPHGGRAIGVVTSGITTGNSGIVKYKNSRRFLATRSGNVKAWAYQNRLLTIEDIEGRQSRQIYQDMVAAVGLDPYRGSYMLGNSYHVGNGGLQEVSLQTDKNGLPSGEIIAISRPYVPYDRDVLKWRYEDFKSTGYVEAGQIYHLVWENLNPPAGAITNLSSDEAKNAPRSKGAISLDGPKAGDWIDIDEPYGPFLRDIPAVLTQKSAGSPWVKSDVVAWYSLVYTDDVEVGETYRHLHGQSPYRYNVDGSSALRQQFTWKYDDISLDRIATRFGHTSNANGKPMKIVIKNSSGSSLATAQIAFDPELRTAAQSSNYWRERQTRHSVRNLSSTVKLEKNQKYYVEFTADTGAGFIVSPAVIGKDQHGTSDRNIWQNANAQQSKDGGKTWKGLNIFPDSDIPMYFIPVGIPTQTPKF